MKPRSLPAQAWLISSLMQKWALVLPMFYDAELWAEIGKFLNKTLARQGES